MVTKPMASNKTSMTVKATALGHYKYLRQPGATFDVDFGRDTKGIVEKSSWLEPVKSTPPAVKAAES